MSWNKIISAITDSANTKLSLIDGPQIATIEKIVGACVEALKNGNAIYWCGNGGSAADAQHLAAELSGRFYYDRPPLPSDALHCNTSYLTAVGNDYGYDKVYSRLIQGIGKEGDVLIGMTTSGKSPNIINALIQAHADGIKTISFCGEHTEDLEWTSDLILSVPSSDTPRIQECHMLVGHIICQLIEEELYPKT
jgi:D-sedoheptulose 7-phosphate isomerase